MNVRVIVIILAAVIVIGGLTCAYTVDETEQVVITRFGRVERVLLDPGLHFKIPLIQKVTSYEKRNLRWDGDPKEVPTRDKRFIWVDATARWKIVDPLKFLQVIGTYDQAYAKLDDTLDSVVKDYVSANPLVELVSTSDLVETGLDLRHFMDGSVEFGGVLFDPIMRAGWDIPWMLQMALYVFVLSIFAGLYPARKAGRISPARAMRYH